MKPFLLALAWVWLAVAGGISPARAATPAQAAVVLGAAQSPYPGKASLSLDFANSVFKTRSGYSRTNLLKWSQDFTNAAWSPGTGGSVTGNAVAAPDGTTTAGAYTWATSTGSFAWLSQQITGNAALSYTYAVWLRVPSVSKNLRLRLSDVSATTLQSADQVITSSWQRFSFAVTAGQLTNTGTVGVGFVAATSGSIAAGDTLYVWGGQLEQSGVSSSYIATGGASSTVVTYQSNSPSDVGLFTFTRGSTGFAEDCYGNLVSFGANVPRITCKGFLVEEARTNLVVRSQQFDDAAWSKGQATITADATAAPDGTLTADRLVEITGAGNPQVYQTVTVVASSIYTSQVYLKAGERTWARIRNGATTEDLGAYINLNTCALGTVQGGRTATAAMVAGGWCKVTITYTAANTSAYAAVIYTATADGTLVATGDNTKGFYLWQADEQLGGFATSPIPTTSATATRPADSAIISGLATGLPYSLGGQFMLPAMGSNTFDLVNSGPDLNNLQGFYVTGGSFQGYVYSAGSITANVASGFSPSTGVPFNMAARFNTNSVNVSSNGLIGTTDTSTAPVSMSNLNITPLAFGGTKPNGYWRGLYLYPYAANDNELQWRSVGNW